MADYPYLASNKNVSQVFERVRTAAKPPKFTIAFMKQLGFTSSNDSAYPSLFKKLGFSTDDGTPTIYYDNLRDSSTAKIILAERIRELYGELFTINTRIYEAPDEEVKGAISRVTGKDEQGVSRIFNTFKALCANADFSGVALQSDKKFSKKESSSKIVEETSSTPGNRIIPSIGIQPDFHYNIQIHLPATTDISVYNAIFKSIRENLLK